MTFTACEPDTSDQPREPETSPIVDAVCGDLTVTFDIHYIDGPAGDRIADAQAKAIYNLLEWVARQDAATSRTRQIDAL